MNPPSRFRRTQLQLATDQLGPLPHTDQTVAARRPMRGLAALIIGDGQLHPIRQIVQLDLDRRATLGPDLLSLQIVPPLVWLIKFLSDLVHQMLSHQGFQPLWSKW